MTDHISTNMFRISFSVRSEFKVVSCICARCPKQSEKPSSVQAIFFVKKGGEVCCILQSGLMKQTYTLSQGEDGEHLRERERDTRK